MSYSPEYIARHRAIAKVKLIEYRSAAKFWGFDSYRTDSARILVLGQIQYAKKVAGKHVTARDYSLERSRAAEIGRILAKADAKREAA
jgi:hypothetical protein